MEPRLHILKFLAAVASTVAYPLPYAGGLRPNGNQVYLLICLITSMDAVILTSVTTYDPISRMISSPNFHIKNDLSKSLVNLRRFVTNSETGKRQRANRYHAFK
jgi:hypothetical protein